MASKAPGGGNEQQLERWIAIGLTYAACQRERERTQAALPFMIILERLSDIDSRDEAKSKVSAASHASETLIFDAQEIDLLPPSVRARTTLVPCISLHRRKTQI